MMPKVYIPLCLFKKVHGPVNTFYLGDGSFKKIKTKSGDETGVYQHNWYKKNKTNKTVKL